MDQINYKPRLLEGRVAVITGGSSGIGFASARRLVDEGAHVFITGRRQDELHKAAQELGPNVTPVQGDVSRMQDLNHLYDTVKKTTGHIDILFANAGMGEFCPIGIITERHFDTIFAVNVKGLLFTVQKALPFITDGGSIILNASRSASKGIAAWSVYSATKAAVRSFARSWTVDLKPRGIRVNAISPAAIDTPGLHSLALGSNPLMFDSAFLSSIPMGRLGTPEEVADVVCFLASPHSTYITGSEVFIDGGAAQI